MSSFSVALNSCIEKLTIEILCGQLIKSLIFNYIITINAYYYYNVLIALKFSFENCADWY